jgi:hypothetical protein
MGDGKVLLEGMWAWMVVVDWVGVWRREGVSWVYVVLIACRCMC